MVKWICNYDQPVSKIFGGVQNLNDRIHQLYVYTVITITKCPVILSIVRFFRQKSSTQSLFNIANNIIRILKSHGYSNQIRRYTDRLFLNIAQLGVGG